MLNPFPDPLPVGVTMIEKRLEIILQPPGNAGVFHGLTAPYLTAKNLTSL
jgi:hypothetical protein